MFVYLVLFPFRLAGPFLSILSIPLTGRINDMFSVESGNLIFSPLAEHYIRLIQAKPGAHKYTLEMAK